MPEWLSCVLWILAFFASFFLLILFTIFEEVFPPKFVAEISRLWMQEKIARWKYERNLKKERNRK